MKAYKYLFFDIDNTLLDFHADEQQALRKLFYQYASAVDYVQIKAVYQRINSQLWMQYERNEVTKDYLLVHRFKKTFETFNITVNSEEVAQTYQIFLAEGHHLMPGALELLEQLSQKDYKLYIVSNGLEFVQKKRLKNTQLEKYFPQVFVSEATGYQKPMKQFFDYVFEHSPEADRAQSLIIGDSLSADIQGAENAGIDSCWMNPQNSENNYSVKPTFEINRLSELLQLV